MKVKHCQWCDHTFETSISYQIYCSAECRDAATKENIAKRYQQTKRSKRIGRKRQCKSCGNTLSAYNDEQICLSCDVNPTDVSKVLKDMKGLANGKD